MSDKGKVLIVSPDSQLPPGLTEALDELQLHGEVCPLPAATSDKTVLEGVDAAVLALNKLDDLAAEDLRRCAEQFEQAAVQALVLAGQAAGAALPEGFLYAAPDESSEMLKGRLATLVDLRPRLQELQLELQRLRMLNGPLNTHFTQVDEEMRLAARLQRDFLPRELPEIPGVKFATLFRPATLVSGDIYDVRRLDEHHVGFYVADVVGHGMPAALLTIFIKQALVTKQIEGNRYTLIDPAAALRRLNDELVVQDLSNFQFATCCYAILDTRTLRLRVANAGHPAPIRINRHAQETELQVSGPLLGVFPDPEYTTEEYQLHRGDKLLLYSDGVEVAFVNPGPDEPVRFRQECGDLAHCDITTMTQRLMEIIDREEGSLHPRDDVTIVGVEIENSAPAAMSQRSAQAHRFRKHSK